MKFISRRCGPVIILALLLSCKSQHRDLLSPSPQESTSEKNLKTQPHGAQAFNRAMMPLVEIYLQVQTALASDSIEGVSQAVEVISKIATALDTKEISGPNKESYLTLPAEVRQAAHRMSQAKNLAEARKMFFELSRPLTMWASVARPKGIALAYCSMADGGWLQKQGPLRNPYYGSEMLECGEFIEP